MNIFLRILLTIYAFCMAILSLVVILATLQNDIFEMLYDYSKVYIYDSGSMVPRLVVLGIALLFFIISLVFLFASFKKDRDKKGVSKQTSMGEILISLNSIEKISINAAKRISGIYETKIFINKVDDMVSIKAKLTVLPETNIPVLSDDIQSSIKKAVEENAGIGVRDIKVVIDSVHENPPQKPPQKNEMTVRPRVE
ncbi:MAG: alkaline shock response membrane anchor protein AmaP [Clostridiales bacterium]|nr:alkaline shock response membrane anchor protein AmaP [Clostridiales bacterium]